MRLTPAQLAVHLICGKQLPTFRRATMTACIRDGRLHLRRITGKDFGYDLAAWHEHLKESREGGYTWSRKIVLPRIMKEALESHEWRRAVEILNARGH
jgi:hypothetical protein